MQTPLESIPSAHASRRPFLRSILLAFGIGASGALKATQTDAAPDTGARADASSSAMLRQLRDGLTSMKLALARDASPSLGLKYPEDGTRTRHWAEVASKQIELSGISGADPSARTDSYAAVRRGLQIASERRGELIIDGGYRIDAAGRMPIEITAPMTLRGAQHRSGNIPSLDGHQAGLYFDHDVASGILVRDSQLTVDGCAILGPARSSTGAGIRVTGENAALRLCGGTVIQSWHIGVRYENGYYHRINDACVIDCVIGLQVSASSALPPIYNLVITQLKLTAAAVPGSTGLSLWGGSQISIAQSSFENFSTAGIDVRDASLDLFSNYFEGYGGDNVRLSDKGRVNAIGNRVYLNKGANRWIRVVETATETQVVAIGNHFVMPEDAVAADAYVLRNDDALAVSNIGEDIILNRTTIGPNARYIAPDFFAGRGPAALRGSHGIRFPVGHARHYLPVSTVPAATCPAQSAFEPAPIAPVILPFACTGSAGDDPGGWRSSGWGAHPMMMAFHRSADIPEGQWEKVGLRLPPVPAPSGGSVVDVEARATISALLHAFARQGVMPPR